MSTSLPKGAIARHLKLRKISALAKELEDCRSVNETREANIQGAGIFDFVKGLHLAARLTYILKEKLSPYHLDANWGQILDEDGFYLSPECDIIVHKEGHFDRWDGEGGDINNIMDFRFIELKKVVAVISCKSYLTSITKKYTNYCQRMKLYLEGREFWLFAECIPNGKEKNLNKKARSIGHNGFWYLYTWDKKRAEPEENRPLWEKFIDEIDKLGQEVRGTERL
jgi:hypothetical protein